MGVWDGEKGRLYKHICRTPRIPNLRLKPLKYLAKKYIELLLAPFLVYDLTYPFWSHLASNLTNTKTKTGDISQTGRC